MNKTVFLLSALVATAPALALVLGGTNFNISGYPGPACVPPYKPKEFDESYQAQLYAQDRQYFMECIAEYVENATNDIERIREAIEGARLMAEGETMLDVDDGTE